jgi:hypothetical protein
MVTFALFILCVAVLGLIVFGLIVFLNSFLDWNMEIELQAAIAGGAGFVAFMTGGMMLTGRDPPSLLMVSLAMVGVPLFLGSVTLLIIYVGSWLRRLALNLGTRANQARVDYQFHRNQDHNG